MSFFKEFFRLFDGNREVKNPDHKEGLYTKKQLKRTKKYMEPNVLWKQKKVLRRNNKSNNN